MSVRIVIPVRDPALGKSRLASALGPPDRYALNMRFFRHTLEVAINTVGRSACYVVSHSTEILRLTETAGVHAIRETSLGLNAALEQAATEIGCNGPLLSLSTDLPLLARADLAAMIAAGKAAQVVIAGDVGNTGTNALLLARPDLIRYRYGIDSLARHIAQAKRAGLRHAIIRRPGLAHDVDTPAELAAWPEHRAA